MYAKRLIVLITTTKLFIILNHDTLKEGKY